MTGESRLNTRVQHETHSLTPFSAPFHLPSAPRPPKRRFRSLSPGLACTTITKSAGICVCAPVPFWPASHPHSPVPLRASYSAEGQGVAVSSCGEFPFACCLICWMSVQGGYGSTVYSQCMGAGALIGALSAPTFGWVVQVCGRGCIPPTPCATFHVLPTLIPCSKWPSH